MAISEELFALSKAYPIASIVIAVILFFIGIKVTSKLSRLVFWALAIIGVGVAVYMLLA
ncbi:MAG: hypothetical protein Q8N63_08700 [Nanoarchaeota archaeon]|nr:hypothetical protein [Nanoarchaeota archaeon]